MMTTPKFYIRELLKSEVDLCLEGGESFFKEGGIPGRFNANSFSASWQKLIDSQVGHIFGLFRDDVIIGALGCVKFPDMFTGDTHAIENFWYTLPSARGRGLKLIEYYEDWALRSGCARCGMIHLTSLYPEALERYYVRRGYKLWEHGYFKELK